MIRQTLPTSQSSPPAIGGEEDSAGLAHLLGSLASLGDPESVTEVLGEYLGCEVTFVTAPREGEVSEQPREVVQHDGDALWVSVPLVFDRSQVGWLRAAMKRPSAFAFQLLVLAGRITACILWEQSRAQRSWLRVLEGEPVTAGELTEAARALGWPAGTHVGVLAACVQDETCSNGGLPSAETDHAWHRCSLPLGCHRHLRTLSFCRGSRLAVFVPLGTTECARETAALGRFAAAVQAALTSRQREPCAIGIGGATADLDRLPRLWRVASRALEWGMALHGRASVTSADSFGILGLLVDHVPGDLLEDACRHILGPLLEHDARKGTGFCQTLQVFLNCDGHFGEAAKLLYVHENTLRHRMRRIQNTLPVNLSDPYVRAAVFLCLKLHDLGVAGPALPRAPAAGPD